MMCRICETEMVPGKALVNTPRPGVDAQISRHARGHTMSMDGPPVLIEVMKCHNCGHSVQIDECRR